ncbi:Lrp/AsnC ligand binding domain-containing protein [Haloechinothrix sp. YIM 98757]|uniref:Lrp/AsnC ligand binding domain-containing protein n=1 Tax=Haloechinothrix aidingensis TaxID=2752311 RepID=A0A838A8U2_9PSEU|nr:Lrp/AsnC ligand binding domain-containing protein [Haloechinothrix aidingensis]
MITAIVLVHAAPDKLPATAQAIAEIDGVSEAYSCAGEIDIVAIVRVPDHQDLATVIPERINKVPGVLKTDTHIAFRSYSRADTESTFSLGEN